MTLSNRKNLHPTVWRLGWVSFFADLSSEMLYAITPIYLSTVLGASMSSIGLIEGFAEAVASLLKLTSGKWSDRLQKRKVFIATGYLLSALSKPLIGLSHTWLHVFFARATDRVGKGLRSAPRDALISEVSRAEDLGRAFGWHRAMDTMGAAIGPLLSLALLTFTKVEMRTLFLYAVIPGLIAAFIALSIHEAPSLSQPALAAGASPDLSSLKKGPRSPLPEDLKRYILGWSVFALTNSSDVFLLLKARDSGIPLSGIITLYCFYNLVFAVSSPALGGRSDRLGRKKILIFGLTLFTAVYSGFAFAHSWLQYFFLFGIYGISMAATDGVGKAFISERAPPSQKATAQGIFGFSTGISTLFASLMAGMLWDRISPSATFLYGAAGAVICIGILLTLPTSPKVKLRGPTSSGRQ
ncbi:MAG: MFS transporter [Methylotenera sp.]|nr:MFS transporter [Oligoflexia bacterium]